jgi:hypothetical protein
VGQQAVLHLDARRAQAAEPGDLGAGERAAQQAEGVARGDGAHAVVVEDEEGAGGQGGEVVVDVAGGDADRGEALDDAGAVLPGAQAADQPGAGVGHRLVIEVDGVLRAEHDAQAHRARLLHQGEHGPLGGRVLRVGREVAHHLVEVEQAAQAGPAGLAARPADDGVQQQREEEHPPRLVEVGEVQHGDRRARAGLRREPPADVERHAAPPRAERRAGDDGVELLRQLQPVLTREEGVDVEVADLGERRIDHRGDEPFQGEVFAVGERLAQQAGEQDGGGIGERIGVAPDEAQQRRHRADDVLPQPLGVAPQPRGRGGERGEHVDRRAGLGAGREHAHLDALA